MPRQARQKSETNIYHAMIRGNNQQVIFEDNEDYRKFIGILKDCQDKSGFRLFAYCLMGNHVHLLIKPENEELSAVFKRIGSSYAYWYNRKYRRRGHLFQDRYKSEAVESDGYFLTVIRYIHQNPLKAELVDNIRDYRYSSYNDYINGYSNLIDVDFALSIVGKDEFVRLNEQLIKEACIDISENNIRLNDDDARTLMLDISKCANATEFQALSKAMRDSSIVKLKEKGLSIRQISRVTGVSFAIIRRL